MILNKSYSRMLRSTVKNYARITGISEEQAFETLRPYILQNVESELRPIPRDAYRPSLAARSK